MQLDEKTLERVAKTARLNLTSEEKKEFLKQLSEVLNVFSELSKVDTKGVNPSIHPIKIENVFREDKKEKSLTQEQALSMTKNKTEGYFKGPKVM